MLYTKGFDPRSLGEHFDGHGAEFGVATEADYEALADQFLGGSMQDGTEECTDSEGNLIRFNRITNYFGVLSPDMYIRTFFIPRRKKPGVKGHNKRTNYIYFKSRCKQ